MFDFLLRAADSLSIGALLGIIFGGILFLVVFIVAARLCHNFAVNTEKRPLSAVKIGCVAIAPCVAMFVGMFHIDIPIKYIIAATVIISVIVLVWNLFTFGIFGGLLFSFVHIVAGVLAGLSVAGLVIAVIALIAVALFGGSSGSIGSGSSQSVDNVRNLQTGEVFHVTKGVNGIMYINGSTILRASDYAGRFIDDNGNQYIAV